MFFLYLSRQRQCPQCLNKAFITSRGYHAAIRRTQPGSNQINPVFNGFQQRLHFHTLLRIKNKNVRPFRIIDADVHAYITRISIGKSLYGQRTFTTQVIRAVMRVAKVRYLLLGAAGAGAVGVKMVGALKGSINAN